MQTQENGGLTIRVIECSGGEEKLPMLEPGFYYDVVEEGAEKREIQPLLMFGPFSSAENAVDNANSFIEDCDTEYSDLGVDMPQIKVKKLHENAKLPTFGSEGAAGADLYAVEDVVIERGKFALIKTGIAVNIPKGFEMQIRPRSGLAFKHGITVMNTPGTIDSDYRGEVGVILWNTGANNENIQYRVDKGERIAQAVISAVPETKYVEVEELDDTIRGEGGFGSTGEK